MLKNLFIAALTIITVSVGIGLLANQPSHAQYGTSYPNCGAVRGTGSYTIAQNGHAYPAYGSYYSTQRRGNSNACVRDIQVALNAVCSSTTKIVTDGIYGAKTARAVTNYQRFWASAPWYTRVNGSPLGVDGVVGPQTWTMLTSWSNNAGGSVNCAA